MQTVHERIRKVIKDIGCSEREFSTRLGRVNRWANQLINKKSNLSHVDILKMKEIFGVALVSKPKKIRGNTVRVYDLDETRILEAIKGYAAKNLGTVVRKR